MNGDPGPATLVRTRRSLLAGVLTGSALAVLVPAEGAFLRWLIAAGSVAAVGFIAMPTRALPPGRLLESRWGRIRQARWIATLTDVAGGAAATALLAALWRDPAVAPHAIGLLGWVVAVVAASAAALGVFTIESLIYRVVEGAALAPRLERVVAWELGQVPEPHWRSAFQEVVAVSPGAAVGALEAFPSRARALSPQEVLPLCLASDAAIRQRALLVLGRVAGDTWSGADDPLPASPRC